MVISDANTPELWVAGFAFVILAVAILFGGVVPLDVCTLDVDESLPATMAVMGTMLALRWFDGG